MYSLWERVINSTEVYLWLRWGAVCMCVPVCGWCLAWGHVSCLTTRHPMSGKPRNFSKDFPWADGGFLSGTELRTHALSCDYAKYTQEVKTSTILQSLIFKTYFFLTFSLFSWPTFFSLTFQDRLVFPKAMHWVFLSRKSPCWAWCQTQRRYSAPYQAVFPCWVPHPSTKLLWPRSRDVCRPLNASMRRSWEGFYAGQSPTNMTKKLDLTLFQPSL